MGSQVVSTRRDCSMHRLAVGSADFRAGEFSHKKRVIAGGYQLAS